MDLSTSNLIKATDGTDFYLTAHSLNKPSQLYAYAFWAIIFLLACASKVRLPNRLRRQADPFLRWTIIRHPAGVRKASPTSPDFLPSNGNILFMAAFFVLLVSLFCFGPDYIPGQGFNIGTPGVQEVMLKSLWTSAARAGLIAFCLLPLTVLLGLKSSPASVFTWRLTAGLYFDKLAVFHRWTARFLYFFTTLHVVLWTAKLSMDRVDSGEVALRSAFGKDRFLCGWVAFGTFTLLMISSTTALRKLHYETFYALHVFLFPLMLIMSALHHPETGWWAWASLFLWTIERIWRAGRIAGYNYNLWLFRSAERSPRPVATDDNEFLEPLYRPPPGYAHAELLGGATIRVTYSPIRRIHWAAGQHFLLTIPAISKFTSHPFTCASVSPKVDSTHADMVFLIRAKAGWTKGLWDVVASHAAQQKNFFGNEPPPDVGLPPSGLLLRMLVDGPFGSSVRVSWKDHSSVLIVVGGSGVTFGLSVLKHLCRAMAASDQRTSDAEKGGTQTAKLQRIRFVWLVREFGHIQWCASVIRECKSMLPKHQLCIDIFVTNTKTQTPTRTDEKDQSNWIDMGEPPLLPPLPAFHTLGRNFIIPFMIPNTSTDSFRSDVGGSHVSLGYAPNHPFFQSRDLTDFEGDSEIILPGEISLSRRIKREGRVRRANTRQGRSSGSPSGSWDMVPSPLSQSFSGRPSFEGLEKGPEDESPSSSSIQGHPFFNRERRIASGSSSGSSDVPSPGSESLPSWLPLHCDPGTPPRAFAQTEPLLENGGPYSPIHVRLDARELKDIAIIAEDTKPGKPKLAHILDEELAEAAESILVACCGPVSLDALVRETIAAKMSEEYQKQEGKLITYYSEEFSY